MPIIDELGRFYTTTGQHVPQIGIHTRMPGPLTKEGKFISGLGEDRVKIPETKITAQLPGIPPFYFSPTPTFTIPERYPDEKATVTGGLDVTGPLMPPKKPEDTQIIKDITILGSTPARYGQDVTTVQKELYKEHYETVIHKHSPPIVLPAPKFPDIFGGLKDIGKYVLIGGAILIGAMFLTKGRK